MKTRGAFSVVGLLLLWGAAAAASEPLATVPEETKLQLVDEINRDRANAGLRPVAFSPELSRAADEHCVEMIRYRYLSHWNLEGWKPYLRYSRAGIRDYTGENIWGLFENPFHGNQDFVKETILRGHRAFMEELPPEDSHRQNILQPQHTHVGIGVAYDENGVRLIEVFSGKYVDLKALPEGAKLDSALTVEGRVRQPGGEVIAVSVYYEPLPKPMTPAELRRTGGYGLPHEEYSKQRGGNGGFVVGGDPGSLTTDQRGMFSAPVILWKKKPGVYTVAVWMREGRSSRAFIGGETSIIVDQ